MGLVLAVMAGAALWLGLTGHGSDGAAMFGWTVLLGLLVGRMAIVTEVTPDMLRVRLWPFPTKTYALADIASAEVREYKPVREYGGWGLRFGPSGIAWNAYGTQGVQLVLRSGKRVLIGSQQADELARAIQARI